MQIGNVTALAAVKVETMQPSDAAPDAGQVIRAPVLQSGVAGASAPCCTGHARTL